MYNIILYYCITTAMLLLQSIKQQNQPHSTGTDTIFNVRLTTLTLFTTVTLIKPQNISQKKRFIEFAGKKFKNTVYCPGPAPVDDWWSSLVPPPLGLCFPFLLWNKLLLSFKFERFALTIYYDICVHILHTCSHYGHGHCNKGINTTKLWC
jgi:hypothetical protein